MNKKLLVTNVILFQLVWFVSVIGAANAMPFLSLAMLAIMSVLHFYAANNPLRELGLLLIVAITGFAVDSTLLQTGIVQYQGPVPFINFAPIWIVVLWAGFAATLNVSLRWLRQNIPVAFVLGAVFGPLAYYGGEKLGALTVHQGALGFVVIGLFWSILMPILFSLARRFDGFSCPLKTEPLSC